jgi:hypothetical protein
MSSLGFVDVSASASCGVGTPGRDVLEVEICQLAADLAAGTARWLDLVAEYDRRELWAQWECRSMAHWLCTFVSMSLVTARQHVVVARVIQNFPLLHAEFAAGRLSFSRVRALCRVITPESEVALVELARCTTASQLDRVVSGLDRAKKQAVPGSDDDQFDRRRLHLGLNDDGTWTLRACLPAEIGAAISRALTFELQRELKADRRRCHERIALGAHVDEGSGVHGGMEDDSAASLLAVGSVPNLEPIVESLDQKRVDALYRLVTVGHLTQEQSNHQTSGTNDNDTNDNGVDDRSIDDRSIDDRSIDDRSIDDRSIDDRSIDDRSIDDSGSGHGTVRPAGIDRVVGKSEQGTSERGNTEQVVGGGLGEPVVGGGVGDVARGSGVEVRPLVVLHRYPNGDELENGPAITKKTADRLSSRADIMYATHTGNLNGAHCNHCGGDGEARITFSRRTPSAPCRRALAERNQGCRFAGCNRKANLHAHHIVFHSVNGQTVAVNLVMLCDFHHHAIHHRGWSIIGNPNGELTFTKPGLTRRPVLVVGARLLLSGPSNLDLERWPFSQCERSFVSRGSVPFRS